LSGTGDFAGCGHQLKGLNMKLKRNLLSTLVAAACGLGAAAAQAQISDGVIKIGVMNDM